MLNPQKSTLLNRPWYLGFGERTLKSYFQQSPSTQRINQIRNILKTQTCTLKKIYEMFREYYKQRTNQVLTKPAYKAYHKFFKTEFFNYGFMLPRTDFCDYRSECRVKLARNLSDPCKVL